MWKLYKKTVIITFILTLVPILFGVALWDQLPEKIATHFDFNNQPDGWSSKAFTVFGLPCIMVAIQSFTLIATHLDPKKKNIAEKPMFVVLWIIPIMSWLLSLLTYSYALGYTLNIGAIIVTFLGVLFIFIGNYVPKNQKNYSYGTRTRWALEDEDNWYQTNRISGICMVIGGILLAICGLLMFFVYHYFWLVIIEIVILLFMTLYPIWFSYRYYIKNQPKNK